MMNSVVKTVKEAARETNVICEADVVVVGGGPGGHTAAVAAARNGAKTVLVERYGHLGGLATGGLVIQILLMSDGTNEQQIGGICQEWIDRLDVVDSVIYPKKEELGSSDKKVLARWRHVSFAVIDNRVRLTATMDPEMLKCVLNDMVEEAGVKLFLHSWGTQAIVDSGEVKGIIFESKSGRHAILGQVIIDGTGDGDIMTSAGADFDDTLDQKLRASNMALVWREGNVDFNKFCDFKETNKEKYDEMMTGLKKATGGTILYPHASSREDIVWMNNNIPGLSATNVEHLTSVEVKVRKIMRDAHEYLRKNAPGFENSFIIDTASQIGTRGGRRLIGEYIYTEHDMRSGMLFNDTIAVFPATTNAPMSGIPKGDSTRCYIPYRSLVPLKVDGLLVACRAFSSDVVSNNWFNWIPHCIAFGEAAGTAAAIATKAGIKPREVDYGALQEKLLSQGVLLPGVKRVKKKP